MLIQLNTFRVVILFDDDFKKLLPTVCFSIFVPITKDIHFMCDSCSGVMLA